MPAGLPVLSSLTEFITGTFNDQFKKLIQPAPLVAASIFAALQFVVLYPPLAERYPALAEQCAALPAAWQAVLVALLILSLGYLLGSLADLFLNIVSGAALSDSPLVGRALLALQRKRFADAQKKGNSDDSVVAARALRRLAYHFPREKANLAPTRLGNVLAGVGDYTWHQYGAALSVIWPTMDLTLKEKNDTLRGQLDDNRTALTFLATVSVLLAVVATEVALLYVALGQPWPALWAIPLAAVAYLVYAAGVQKAEAWSAGVRTAFDLHLEDVGAKMGLRALSGPTAEKNRKERWEQVSRWLTYGAVALDPAHWELETQKHDWYAPPAGTPPVTVQHPPTVSVQQWGQARCGAAQLSGTDWVFGLVADYIFVVSHAAAGRFAPHARNVTLLVTDPALDPVPLAVPGTVAGVLGTPTPVSVTGERLDGAAPALKWAVGDIAPGGSATLRYQIHHAEVKVSVNAPFVLLSLEEDERGAVSLRIRNEGASAAACVVTVETPRDLAPPSSLNYGAGLAAEPVPPASWETEMIAGRSEFEASFRRKP